MFNGGTLCINCHLSECDRRCPEAPQPRRVLICAKCGENIYEGESAFRFSNDTYCEDCADNMSIQDLAEQYGETGWTVLEREGEE